MTRHLSPEEFVDALEGTTSPVSATHLRECESCRAELADMRSVLDDARAVEASEPSPLFWDHFSARVKAATLQEPSGAAWLSSFSWRPVTSVCRCRSRIGARDLRSPRSSARAHNRDGERDRFDLDAVN